MLSPAAFTGTFRSDSEARAVYSEGAGIARALPSAVAVPADADDVVRLVRWAAAEGVAIIPRGSGSGMAGGAVGPDVIVDLSTIRQCDPVDAEGKRVVAGPGAICADVDRAARLHGLRFPVDPSSAPFCTIGGMVATNAAGARSLRYGATRSWVESLECVFADGSRGTVRRSDPWPDIPAAHALQRLMPEIRAVAEQLGERPRPLKDSSGYAIATFARTGDLIDLLVGSEGTLALFTGIGLSLDSIPNATSAVLASFASLDDAASAANGARVRGASACELLDRTFIELAADGGAPLDVPDGTEAVILAELEGDSLDAAGVAGNALKEAFVAAGATSVHVALAPEDTAVLWAMRHAASPSIARLDPALRSMQFIEDGAVPPGALPEYVKGVRAALASRGMRGVIFGHAGDSHAHVNPLVDLRLPEWRSDVEAILAEVTALVARLGGTLAGEHGDGRLRTPLLDRTWPPEALSLFASIKQCFDPGQILNPGVKLPMPGQRPLNDVKYDPTLPPLPAAARRALDRVESERAYSSFRLDLLSE
jgi:FAD/FMN-containing dehydrogenase